MGSTATARVILVPIVGKHVLFAIHKVLVVFKRSLSLALQITFLSCVIEHLSLESVLLMLRELRVCIYLVDTLLRPLTESDPTIKIAIGILLHLKQLLIIQLHHVLHIDDALIFLERGLLCNALHFIGDLCSLFFFFEGEFLECDCLSVLRDTVSVLRFDDADFKD